MKIFRTTILNGLSLKDFPFKREFELEGCLAMHPELLSIDEEELTDVEIVELEANLEGDEVNRKGRMDMLVSYGDGKIGVVELKNDVLSEVHLKQLKKYVDNPKRLAENKALDEYSEQRENDGLNLSSPDTYVGVLLGVDIDKALIDKIQNAKATSVDVYAIVLKRYKADDGSVFLTSMVYAPKNRRDYGRYKIEGDTKTYCKSRLVLEVIRRYVASHKNLTYGKLKQAFPDSLRGVKKNGWGCFAWRSDAEELANKKIKRHFIKDDEVVRLKDGVVAVSTQWGIGNINAFIEHANKHHQINIERV